MSNEKQAVDVNQLPPDYSAITDVQFDCALNDILYNMSIASLRVIGDIEMILREELNNEILDRALEMIKEGRI